MLTVTSGHLVMITVVDDDSFQEWLIEHIKSPYQVFFMENASMFNQDTVKQDISVGKIDVGMLFVFESLSEATLFKLTWAGQ